MTEQEQETLPENGNEQENNTEEESGELESAIIRQMEYYFGDFNILRDKFLREQIKLDDGWVPLDVMLKFNRLKELSTDKDVIANALNKSTSGLLEVSEDNQKVRRSPEMPVPEMNEERRKELQGRTVYAKGFPKNSKLDDILKFFKEQGDVETVIMRRYPDKNKKTRLFKGSVFATFKNKDEAVKFIETKGLKYGETDLLTMWQDEFLQKKQEEYAEKKEKREKKSKAKEAATEKQKAELKLPTGTLLHFCEAADSTTREDIKAALGELGFADDEVSYIDFKIGKTEGWVRLTKENAAKELVEKITDGKLKVGSKEVTFKLIEGDEEKEYLEKTVENMMKRRKSMKNSSKQKKNAAYKGKQSRKRKQDNHEEEPKSKIQADS